MFQVRFHGRGGPGLVTAAELLAAASTGTGCWWCRPGRGAIEMQPEQS
jgi:hypothetical protein